MKRFTLISIVLLVVNLMLNIISATASDYVIGEEDILQVIVWKNPELSTDVVVRPDGKISLPLLDDIQAKGLTPLQLRDVITEKLKDFIEVPDVTVIVKGINSFKIYILVNGVSSQSGVITYAGGPQSGAITLRRETNLLQFLAQIGGVNNIDLEKSYILRDNKRVDLNLVDLIDNNDLSKNINLLPNDTLFINDNYDNRITVVGQVRGPRTINFSKGMRVLDVILAAGGFTECASQNSTKIIRKKGDKNEEIRIKMKDVIEDGEVKENIMINPGDIVIAPKSFLGCGGGNNSNNNY